MENVDDPYAIQGDLLIVLTPLSGRKNTKIWIFYFFNAQVTIQFMFPVKKKKKKPCRLKVSCVYTLHKLCLFQIGIILEFLM